MFEKLVRHADLFADMTQALDRDPTIGVDDFSAAVTWRVAIRKCTSCDNPEACAKLLADAPRLETPPEYCRNAGYLMNLPKSEG